MISMQTKEQKAAYMKARYAANRQRLLAQVKAWQAANTEKILARRQANRQQKAAYQKAYNESHPNKNLAHHHKSRAKVFKVKIGDEKAILAWLEGWKTEAPVACHYCKAVSPGTDMEIDHVIPMSAGGPHDLTNLVVCCKSCNSSKGDKLPKDWQAQINL